MAVKVAGSGDNTLDGGARASVLLGRDATTSSAATGAQTSCAGEDGLRSGAEADFFGGGPGTDAAIDFDPDQGDRQTGIP